MKKVIVIGLDGLEPSVVEPLLAAGELPNLARLRRQGGYAHLATTYPAQTPVAWSTFSTGANPGGHGIFDFLSRDPRTYLPILGLSRYEQKNAFVAPKVVNLRRGIPFWQILSEAGIPATVLRAPCTYPPDELRGRMLSGVGTPDLRGGMGTSTFYSTEMVENGNSEKVVQVQVGKDGLVKTHLIGPRNPKSREDFTFEITLKVDAAQRQATLHSEGQPKALVLKEGQWSDWLRIKFKIGMFQSVHGMLRFFLQQASPTFALYASPINFDPTAPLFPISYPAEYAGELNARLGPFHTVGMAEDHDGLINGRFDEGAYLEQAGHVLHEREAMLRLELERFSEGFLFCLFDTPDRLQHMFWRFREPDHPANRKHGWQPEFMRAIEDHYRELDTIVGRVLESADDQTLLIVLSDHGMNGFQRGLNLNTWLHDNGYLALKNGARPGPDNGDFFQNVDWNRTKAYALGLGTIFLNLKGREAQGCVDPGEAGRLKKAIAGSLAGLCDDERGALAVTSVKAREEIYSGPFLAEAPDLVVNFARGYRVSWGTPLGGVPAGLFEDNTKRWGGDHVIDPALAPGVLFMNQPFNGNAARLLDLAPTILGAFGLAKIPAMEGENLLP